MIHNSRYRQQMRYLQNAQLRVDNKQVFTIGRCNNEIIVVLLSDLCDPALPVGSLGVFSNERTRRRHPLTAVCGRMYVRRNVGLINSLAAIYTRSYRARP